MARMRHFLKRCPAVLLSAALLAAAAGTAAAADTPAPTLGIYTTGDMGGRLYREDPVTGEAVEYSYQNVASAMEAERASVDAALLLDSGDAVDNGLVQDGGAAEALALRAIGYDALVPAVGEFRLGPEARDDFFAALGEASEDGAPVRVLSGNYLDEDTQSPEEDAYEVFTVELGRRAVRIGVLGLGAMEAPEELPESFVSGVRFAHRDNTSGSYSWEWTGYWQERLEKENCDLVVVVCHAGLDELARFAAETTGIDLLVGGHGEAAAESLQNADGEPVSLVSGGGTSLTRTTITLSPKGEAVVGASTLALPCMCRAARWIWWPRPCCGPPMPTRPFSLPPPWAALPPLPGSPGRMTLRCSPCGTAPRWPPGTAPSSWWSSPAPSCASGWTAARRPIRRSRTAPSPAERVPTCSMVWTTPSIWGLLRDSGWTASPLRALWWTTSRPSV